MSKVLILEDEKDIRNHFARIVRDTLDECEVFTAATGKEAMDYIKKENIDLMLLDIELDEQKKVLGLDYATMISCMNRDIDFIVISGFSNYLEDAGNVEPFYYFMKPVDECFLIRKLQEWELIRKNARSTKNLKIVTESGMAIVPIDKIIFIEKMRRNVILKTSKKEYVAKESLKGIRQRLDNRFFCTHQSFVVNLNHIESLEIQDNRSWSIKFKDIAEEALLSRYKADEFFGIFENLN